MQFSFVHKSHLIDSAHALSFRPNNEITKQNTVYWEIFATIKFGGTARKRIDFKMANLNFGESTHASPQIWCGLSNRLKMAGYYEDNVYEVKSCVRGHHVYHRIWTPTIGEELTCQMQSEPQNTRDPYAVAVILPCEYNYYAHAQEYEL